MVGEFANLRQKKNQVSPLEKRMRVRGGDVKWENNLGNPEYLEILRPDQERGQDRPRFSGLHNAVSGKCLTEMQKGCKT
jgi:hypothetical protein